MHEQDIIDIKKDSQISTSNAKKCLKKLCKLGFIDILYDNNKIYYKFTNKGYKKLPIFYELKKMQDKLNEAI